MNTAQFQDLMWRALVGTIGHEKTARLRHNDLDTLVRSRYNREGNALDTPLTPADAAALMMKRAFVEGRDRETTRRGIAALKKIAHVPAKPEGLGLFEKIAHAYKLYRTMELASPALYPAMKVAFDHTAKDVYNTLIKEGSALQGMAPKSAPTAEIKGHQNVAAVEATGVADMPLGYVSPQGEKTASYNASQEFLDTVFLDAIIPAQVPKEKVASVAAINREYGMTLLFGVLHGE